MRYGLVPYIGAGTAKDPARPEGTDVNGRLPGGEGFNVVGEPWGVISLQPSGGGAQGQAVVAWPRLPSGSLDLGDDLDGRLPSIVRVALGNRLGISLEDRTVRQLITDLLLLHGDDADPRKWNRLKGRLGRLSDGRLAKLADIELGNQLVYRQLLAAEGPGAAFADGFAGDGDVPGADLNFTEVSGDFDRVGGRLRLGTASTGTRRYARAEHDVASVDMLARLVVPTLATPSTGTNRAGPCCRFAAAATTCYQAELLKGTTDVTTANQQLGRTVAGTFTIIGSATLIVTPALPHTIECKANGSTIKGFRDGVEIHSGTDTNITTGTRGGIIMQGSVGGAEVDDFFTREIAQTTALGRAEETDESRAVTPRRERIVVQGVETDVANPVTARKNVALGQTSETDTAQPVVPKRTAAAAQATETDTAHGITARKNAAVTPTAETDDARTVTPKRTATTGLTSETDQANGVTPRKDAGVPLATEADEARGITPRRQRDVGPTAETDAAQPITPRREASVAQGTETDAAQGIVPRRQAAVGASDESDAAQGVTPRKDADVGLSGETDTALPITAIAGGVVSQTGETDAAQAVTPRKNAPVAPAAETNTARAVTARKLAGVDQTSESDEARTVVPKREADVARATSSEQAQPVRAIKYVRVGQVIESSQSQTVHASRFVPIGPVVETDQGFTIRPQRAAHVGIASEIDQARTVSGFPVGSPVRGPTGAEVGPVRGVLLQERPRRARVTRGPNRAEVE